MKKKLIVIIFCILLNTSILASPINAEDNSSIKEKNTSIVLSQPLIVDNDEYIIINLKEATSYIMEPGKPNLPIISKTFIFPFKTEIKGVECIPQQIYYETISKEIQPSPSSFLLSSLNNEIEKKNKNDDFLKDAEIYNSNDFFPNTWYKYDIGSGLNGLNHVLYLRIQFYPVLYSPNLNLVKYVDTINIKIKYNIPNEPLVYHDEYDMVVITPQEYSNSIQPFINYKNDGLISTTLVTVEDIYDGTYFPIEGRDEQEQIKYFIKNSIESWGVKYVILAGGTNQVPVRMSYCPDGEEDSFISDLYYADIYNNQGGFCSWDANGNDIFGEYTLQGNVDMLDLYPDVYIGRLNLRESWEIPNVINKLITYQSSGAYMDSWFKKIIVCGGDTFNDTTNIDEGESINQDVINLMTDFSSKKIWATNGLLNEAINIDNAIEEGAGFFYCSGHGTNQNWATHPHDDFNKWIPFPGGYSYNRVEGLENAEKLPIVYIGGCSNSKFLTGISFCWSFIKNPYGGGIASFGYNALGWGYLGSAYNIGLVGGMELSFFKGYVQNDAKTTGELYTNAVNNYLNNIGLFTEKDYKTIEELEPFCDPSMPIEKISDRPNKPQPIIGSDLGVINIEYNYKSFTTDPNGDMIKYCFDWDDGTFSWTDWMNSGVEVSLNHIWKEPGYYNVKVKARDKYGLDSPWSDPLVVHIQGAILEINNIKGGFFKVSAIVNSIGDIEASDVNFSILVEGGYFGKLYSLTEGEIMSTIPIGENVQIDSKIMLGIGKVDITVTVGSPTSNTEVSSEKGFIFGPFIIISK